MLPGSPKIASTAEKKDFIENINNHILAKIINQELNNRDETIEYIKSLENVKINRIRKNQISIKSDYFKDNTPMVLKGDIYEENRDYSDYTREYTATINRDPELVKSKLRELKKDYTAAISDPLQSIVSAVKSALEQTPPELSSDIAELVS